MVLDDKQVRHVKNLCTIDYMQIDLQLKRLDYMEWPEENKVAIRQFLEERRSISHSILNPTQTNKEVSNG